MIKKLSGLSKGKKITLKIILITAGLLLTLYTAFWGMLIAAFSGEVFFTILVPLSVISFFALYCMFLLVKNKRKTIVKITFILFVAVAAASGTKIAWQSYHDSIPRVSIQDFDLREYVPFSGSKRVVLGRAASVTVKKDFPVFDGATAMYPVYAAFAEALYPDLSKDSFEYLYDSEHVKCSNTPFAYSNIINGDADIIFVGAPSQKQAERAKEEGVELKLTPVGREAFVFFVHKDNPDENLTLSQVKDIYSGRAKNWKALGGKNQKIRAFQRPEGSGSQTALERLMAEDKIMKAPVENVPAGMGGMIKEVAGYKNYTNAVGFSFRFFLTGMAENEEVKLLKIDGVYPSKENIENGRYPLSSDFYAVTAGSKNPNTGKILKWILSEEGQEIIEKAGYVKLAGK
jgi:phosphate transport system substrate-binding protein